MKEYRFLQENRLLEYKINQGTENDSDHCRQQE